MGLTGLLDNHKTVSDVASYLCRYGPVFSSHLFGQPVIIASGNEDVKMVLQNEGKLFHAAYPIELTGNTSVPAIHGQPWKDWRRFALSKVGFLALKDRLSTVEEFALNAMSTWEGRRVNVGDEARSVSNPNWESIDFSSFNLSISVLLCKAL